MPRDQQRRGKPWYLVFIQLFSMLLLPVAGVPDYRSTRSVYFTFSFVEEDRKAVESLSNHSTKVAERIMSDLAVPVPGTIRVLIADRGAFNQLQPSGVELPDSTLGVAYPRRLLIILKSPRAFTNPRSDLSKTFIHELTHILLGTAFYPADLIPLWLNEGIAQYQSREWNFARISTMTQAVLTDSLIPLSYLTRSFPDDPRKRQLAYAESFYLISFLITRYGQQKFNTFIHTYSKVKELEDTLLMVYDINLHQLESSWHRYLAMRFSWIPIITSSTTLWFLITLIFIYGYIRKRRKVSGLLKEWEDEEQH